MIYSKKQTLDTTNQIELRIAKSEKTRKNMEELEKNMKAYLAAKEKSMDYENKIRDGLKYFYSSQSSYEQAIEKFGLSLKFKEEIDRKEINLVKKELDKKKPNLFFNLKTLVKDYFMTEKKMKHYCVKLPKLNKQLEEKIKSNTLTEKQKAKLIRNDAKLEKTKIMLAEIEKKIIIETDRINLQKFLVSNPLISAFFSSQYSSSFFIKENSNDLQKLKVNLQQDEKEDYNHKFFMEPNKLDLKKIHSIRENIKSVKKDLNIDDNDYTVNMNRNPHLEHQDYNQYDPRLEINPSLSVVNR